MDLSSIKYNPNEGTWMEVMHPVTSAPTGISIRLVGTDSADYRKVARALQNRRLEKVARQGKVKMTAEEHEENQLAMLCVCVKEWKGMEKDKKEYPCTPENVRALLSDPQFAWLREQIDEFVGERTNFIQD